MIVGNFWRQCCFAVLVQFCGAWWLQVLGSSEKKNHSQSQPSTTKGNTRRSQYEINTAKSIWFERSGVPLAWEDVWCISLWAVVRRHGTPRPPSRQYVNNPRSGWVGPIRNMRMNDGIVATLLNVFSAFRSTFLTPIHNSEAAITEDILSAQTREAEGSSLPS